MFHPQGVIKSNVYKCDKKFHIDSILKMYDNEIGTIGVVFIDGKQIVLNEIKTFSENEYTTKCIYKDSMRLQKQFKGGGQSAQRFDRKEQGIRDGFLSKFDDKVWNLFYDKENNKAMIDILIICGCGTLYNELSKEKLISKYFNNITRVMATQYLDLNTINKKYYKDLLDLNNIHVFELKELISTANDKLVYGAKDIKQSLQECMIEKLVTTDKNIGKTLEYEPEIVVIEHSTFLESYGGTIGIKYY